MNKLAALFAILGLAGSSMPNDEVASKAARLAARESAAIAQIINRSCDVRQARGEPLCPLC